MTTRGAVLGAAAWVLVVSVGATAVWSVISRAGAGVAGELPVPTATAGAATPQAGTPPGGGPEAEPEPGSEPSAGPVTRTWRGAAGSVTASCAAGVSLESARPASGWRVEVDDPGPERVRVEFETMDDRSRVRVESVCRAGVPAFEVDVG